MHDGLPVVVDGVDVGPELEQQLRRLVRLLFRPRLLERGRRAESGCRVQGCGVLDVRQERVRTQVQQHLHQRHVRLVRGKQEWRGPLKIDPRGLRLAGLQACVHVGSHCNERTHELQRGEIAGALRRRVAAVVAHLGLANPGDGVEGRESGPLVVRVGTRLQESDGQFEVPVLDGQQQGAYAGVRILVLRTLSTMKRLVHIDTGTHQGAHRVEATLAHGEEHRVEPGIKRPPEVGTGAQQRVHHRSMPFGRGPHQGRLAVPLRRIHLCAGLDQCLDGAQITGARCGHESRLSARKQGVRVGAAPKQEPYQPPVTVGASQRKRRNAVAIPSIRVGSCIQKKLGRLRVVVIAGPVKRGRAVALRRVHIGAGCKQVSHGVSIASLRCVGQTEPGLRGGTYGKSEQQQEQHADPSPPHCSSLPWLRLIACHSDLTRERPGTGHQSCRCCRRTNRAALRRDQAASGAGWPAACPRRTARGGRPGCRRRRLRRRG